MVVAVTEVTVITVGRRLADRVYVGIAVCIAVTTTALAILVAREAARPAVALGRGRPTGVGLATQVVMVMSPGAYDSPYTAVRHRLGDLPAGLASGAKVVLSPTLVVLLVACAVSLRIRFKRGDETAARS